MGTLHGSSNRSDRSRLVPIILCTDTHYYQHTVLIRTSFPPLIDTLPIVSTSSFTANLYAPTRTDILIDPIIETFTTKTGKYSSVSLSTRTDNTSKCSSPVSHFCHHWIGRTRSVDGPTEHVLNKRTHTEWTFRRIHWNTLNHNPFQLGTNLTLNNGRLIDNYHVINTGRTDNPWRSIGNSDSPDVSWTVSCCLF